MTKNEVIRAIKTIARMNLLISNVEKIFGQPIEDSELTWIVSEMTDNLMDLFDTESDAISNMLYVIRPSDDMEKAYQEFMKNV